MSNTTFMFRMNLSSDFRFNTQTLMNEPVMGKEETIQDYKTLIRHNRYATYCANRNRTDEPGTRSNVNKLRGNKYHDGLKYHFFQTYVVVFFFNFQLHVLCLGYISLVTQ